MEFWGAFHKSRQIDLQHTEEAIANQNEIYTNFDFCIHYVQVTS